MTESSRPMDVNISRQVSPTTKSGGNARCALVFLLRVNMVFPRSLVATSERVEDWTIPIETRTFLPSECCTTVETLRVRQVVKRLSNYWYSHFMRSEDWPHSSPGSAILLGEKDPLYARGYRCLVFDGTHRTIGAREAFDELTKLGLPTSHIKVAMVVFPSKMCHKVPTPSNHAHYTHIPLLLTHGHTLILRHTSSHAHTYAHIYTHSLTLTHTHGQTHTYIHTHLHIYTHAHDHT
jgi:hypothetical protein